MPLLTCQETVFYSQLDENMFFDGMKNCSGKVPKELQGRIIEEDRIQYESWLRK